MHKLLFATVMMVMMVTVVTVVMMVMMIMDTNTFHIHDWNCGFTSGARSGRASRLLNVFIFVVFFIVVYNHRHRFDHQLQEK